MILYMIIGALSMGLACFIDNRGLLLEGSCYDRGRGITRRQAVNYLSLALIFVVLFLPAALRLEVGNDYGSYVDTIHEIYVGGYVVTEPFFNLVVKILCIFAGGEDYLLVFAFFAGIITWLFLKVIYEQTEEFSMAFFLFMTLGIYFRTYNTVRYYFVLAITLYSFRYVLKKEYGKFVLLILFAALFHKSVLVVLPLYIMAALPWKKWFMGLLLLGTGFFFLFQDIIMNVALELYPSYKNTIFLQTESGLSGNLLTIARCIAVLCFCLICKKEKSLEKQENQFYFKLNILAIALYICGSFLPLVGRIGYYLITAHIFLIPSVLSGIEDRKKKRFWTFLVLLAGIMYFILFLRTAHEAGVRVLPYKTWLFYEKEFLNAETIF